MGARFVDRYAVQWQCPRCATWNLSSYKHENDPLCENCEECVPWEAIIGEENMELLDTTLRLENREEGQGL